ncbi:Hypothetical predicted protein [Pelobates cultripes]|uniref:Uncharacterized protein n=1 Tax=Pelobates cultripes TaxID=61616 RepID=A0AAD1T2X1_PELCU|nr:Hypothetical predicted protein [Pelobates cultripes]
MGDGHFMTAQGHMFILFVFGSSLYSKEVMRAEGGGGNEEGEGVPVSEQLAQYKNWERIILEETHHKLPALKHWLCYLDSVLCYFELQLCYLDSVLCSATGNYSSATWTVCSALLLGITALLPGQCALLLGITALLPGLCQYLELLLCYFAIWILYFAKCINHRWIMTGSDIIDPFSVHRPAG